jgi:hypothetical protein
VRGRTALGAYGPVLYDGGFSQEFFTKQAFYLKNKGDNFYSN